MKKFLLITLLFILGCSACQNTATTSLPANTPVPTHTVSPTKTSIPTATPTISKIRAKNLIEWADLRTGKGPVYSQDWSADGRWLVTADYDQVRVWNTASYQEAGVLEGHTSFIWGLAWSPTLDNPILASASQDGSVRLWDVATYTQMARLKTGWAFCVDWSPDGKLLAIGTQNGDVQVWDATKQILLSTWNSWTYSPVISIAWSPDGNSIASGGLNGEITLWDVQKGEALHRITGYTTARSDTNGLAWSPDGSILATAHQDGKVRLWDAGTAELARTIDAHTGWVRGMAWSPDGLLLASTGEDKRICLWEMTTGQKYAEQHHNSLPVWSVSWSPDGKFVASGAGAYKEAHIGATIVRQVP